MVAAKKMRRGVVGPVVMAEKLEPEAELPGLVADRQTLTPAQSQPLGGTAELNTPSQPTRHKARKLVGFDDATTTTVGTAVNSGKFGTETPLFAVTNCIFVTRNPLVELK